MSRPKLESFSLSAQDIYNWYVHKTLNDPHRSRIQTLHAQRICVMGGCGQVGSHLITKLYESGYPWIISLSMMICAWVNERICLWSAAIRLIPAAIGTMP